MNIIVQCEQCSIIFNYDKNHGSKVKRRFCDVCIEKRNNLHNHRVESEIIIVKENPNRFCWDESNVLL